LNSPNANPKYTITEEIMLCLRIVLIQLIMIYDIKF
jgi:hypothetical protein